MIAPGLFAWIADTWSEVWRDRPDQNIHEFAADNVEFTAKMGNITGFWQPNLTPYTLLFQQAVTSDFRDVPEEDWFLRGLLEKGQRVDECFVLKSSQTGFTQAMLNACVYLPLFAPGRLLYALPSKDKAKKLVKVRLLPLLKKLCGAVIADDKDVNLAFIELLDMIMEFGGSFSAELFAEKALRYGFADDVEYMVSEGGVPGMLDGVHVVDHFRSRFTTSDDSFLGVVSKPNLESSQFVTEWKSGSQHRWMVPCPICGQRQTLEPNRLNWSHPGCKDLAGRYDLDAVEALTTYKCVNDHDITEDRKYDMNLAGLWLPKPREDRIRDDDPSLVPRRMSMRVNDLASPFPKVKWGILARLLIEAQHNPAKLRHVNTNHFAIPWRERAINIKVEQVKALRAGAIDPKTAKHYPDDLDGEGRLKVPEYFRGQCPFKPVMISATADVQGDKYKWGIVGWQRDGTAALIEYGACLSDQQLYEMMIDPRAHDGNPLYWLGAPQTPLVVEHGLIDSGHDTFTVYDFCIRTGWLWYPSKGVVGVDMAGALVIGKEDWYEGDWILRYHYHDSALKTNLYKRQVEKAHDPKWKAPRLYLPADVDDEFCTELTAESFGPDPKNPRRMAWHHDKTVGPNDYGDMMKMHYVVWQIVGPKLQRENPLPPPPPTVTPAEVLAAIARAKAAA